MTHLKCITVQLEPSHTISFMHIFQFHINPSELPNTQVKYSKWWHNVALPNACWDTLQRQTALQGTNSLENGCLDGSIRCILAPSLSVGCHCLPSVSKGCFSNSESIREKMKISLGCIIYTQRAYFQCAAISSLPFIMQTQIHTLTHTSRSIYT